MYLYKVPIFCPDHDKPTDEDGICWECLQEIFGYDVAMEIGKEKNGKDKCEG